MSQANGQTSAKVPLLDIGRGNGQLREEIQQAIQEVCDSGRFLHGPDVGRLEQAIADYCGAAHAVSCASGSDALLLSLMACGVGAGDEVIVPSFTFFATASAVWRLGARPVFVDIEPGSFNIDPEHLATLITPATRVIIPVHMFGQCADMNAINDLARAHSLQVVEDAAQAIGAGFLGQRAGSMGDIGCFSFYPTKNLGGFGDGGMLTTNDQNLADQLRLLASHGMKPRYYHSVVGINSRLDTIQAAVLHVKLGQLPQATLLRQANAARYCQLFEEAGLGNLVVLPTALSGREHVWNQFTIRVAKGSRDALREFLGQQGIGTEIYYPVPLHLQACFRSLGYEYGSLPHTEQASRQVLSLPIFAELEFAEQARVVAAIGEYFARQRVSAA